MSIAVILLTEQRPDCCQADSLLGVGGQERRWSARVELAGKFIEVLARDSRQEGRHEARLELARHHSIRKLPREVILAPAPDKDARVNVGTAALTPRARTDTSARSLLRMYGLAGGKQIQLRIRVALAPDDGINEIVMYVDEDPANDHPCRGRNQGR